MSAAKVMSGTLHQYDRPVWEPLLNLVGDEIVADFMWMHEVELADGTRLHAYKHVESRRYLHLDGDGRAFAYRRDSRYEPIAILNALAEAFRGCDGPLAGLRRSDVDRTADSPT